MAFTKAKQNLIMSVNMKDFHTTTGTLFKIKPGMAIKIGRKTCWGKKRGRRGNEVKKKGKNRERKQGKVTKSEKIKWNLGFRKCLAWLHVPGRAKERWLDMQPSVKGDESFRGAGFLEDSDAGLRSCISPRGVYHRRLQRRSTFTLFLST